MLAAFALADQSAAKLPQPSLRTGFWLDAKGTANLETAIAAPFAPLVRPNFGRRHGAVWVHLRVNNPGPSTERLLRVGPTLLERVDLWAPGPGRFSHAAGGLRVPMARRAVRERETLFPVSLPTGQSDLYLRIASPTLLAPIIDLWQATDWQWRARLTDLVNATTLGALLMIVAVTSVYAVWTREWYWLYYGLGTAAFTVFESCDDGLAALWFWPGRPTLSLVMVPIALALQISMYVAFFMRFIPLSRLHRGWRLLWALPAAALMGLAVAHGVDYRVGVPVLYGLVLATDVVLFLLAMTAWRQGFRAGRWALPGFGLILASILHRMGVWRGWWPDFHHANFWLLPLSGVVGTGVLLMAQIDQLREFRAAERRYLEEIATARDRATQANRAKSLLLARVSHDLRTPLQTLMGYLDLVRRERASAALARYLDAIHASTRNMLALIEELLQFARGEEGRLELNARPTFLHRLVQEAADQGQVLARQQGNRFVFDLDLNASVVVVDGERLHSVLMNLLSNACRMTEEGTVIFSVSGRIEGREARLRFEVRDNGPGIAPEDQERIFLPFEQGKAGPRSTGLGLAIVRQLVNLMGGTLQFESVPGHGTVFAVSLAAEVADEGDTDAFLPVTHDTPSGYEGRTRTLLVVGGDAWNLNVMQDLLTGMAFDVITAASVDEALALASNAQPDGAMVEQSLEDGDSWQLLAGLKAMAPNLPVILLSSTPARLPAGLGSAWRFDAELLKPLDTTRLVETLGRCLSLTWRRDPPLVGFPTPSLEVPPRPAAVADLLALRTAAYEGSFFEVENWIARWRQRPEEQGLIERLEPLVAAAKWPAIIRLVDHRLEQMASAREEADARGC